MSSGEDDSIELTLSSSSSEDTKDKLKCCNYKCQVSEEKKLLICLKCGILVCENDTCKKESHKGVKNRRTHVLKSYHKVSAARKCVLDAIYPDITADQRAIDEAENRFFYVDPETNDLALGERFSSIYKEIKTRARIFSVLGDPGIGKSTLARGLCFGNSKPLPGGNGLQPANESTKAYKGPDLSILWEVMKGKEGSAIETALPRMVYAFSDVIVFTFNHTQQKDKCLSQMNAYTTKGITGSANFARLPHLILVLNRTSLESIPSDPLTATEDWKKNCNQEELAKLMSNYSSLKVVHIPSVDQTNTPSIDSFSKQHALLHDFIENGLGQKDGNRTSQFQVMQCALQKLNRSAPNYDEPLDFYELARSGVTIPTMTSKFIEEYFRQYHAVLKVKDPKTGLVLTSPQAWNQAVQHLNQRAFDIYCTCWMRILGRLPPLTQEFLDTDVVLKEMVEAEANIRASAPCKASHRFNGVGVVFCCQVAQGHDGGHRSTQTWSKFPKFGKLLAQPCSWGLKTDQNEPAPYQPQSDQVSLKDSVIDHIKSLNGTVKPDDYSKLRLTALEEAKIVVFNFPKPHTSCFGCMTLFPSHIRGCGHNFCADCLLESSQKCLICDDERPWSYQSMSQYAGIRVLSLPGGGAGCAASLGSLRTLQRLVYDIPIRSLFDYVISTSFSSLVAISLFSMAKTPEQAIELLNEVGKHGFDKLLSSRVPVLGSIYRYFENLKYYRNDFNRILTKKLENVPTFGCAPALAITVVKDEELALISSYVLPEDPDRPKNIISLDAIDSVQAATAGGGLFSRFEIPPKKGGGIFEDSGTSLRDPICVGLQQVSQLFPKQTIDLAVSMETGFFFDKITATPHPIANTPQSFWSQPNEDWNNLQNGTATYLPDSALRIKLPLQEGLSLESFGEMSCIADDVQKHFYFLGRDGPSSSEPDPKLQIEPYKQMVELSHRSVATMFSLEGLQMKVNPIKDGDISANVSIGGLVCSRYPLPISLLEALGDAPFDFSFHSSKKHEELTNNAKILSFKKTLHRPGSVDFSFSLSAEVAIKKRFWLSIRCTVGSLAGPLPQPLHISGSPWLMSSHSSKVIPGRQDGNKFSCAPGLTFTCPLVHNLVKTALPAGGSENESNRDGDPYAMSYESDNVPARESMSDVTRAHQKMRFESLP